MQAFRSYRSHLKALAAAAPIAALFCFGCSDNNNDVINTQSPGDVATAEVRGYTDSLLRGTIVFTNFSTDSLRIQGSVSGLIPGGVYAIHVHQFGNCSAPDSSGEHFGAPAEPHGNPLDSLGQHHRGDLPSLQVNANGVGSIDFRTNAITLNPGARSVAGRSIVVHALPDDYVSQPAGNSDGRIGCGVIGTGTPVKDTTTVPITPGGTPGGTPIY